MSLLRYPKYKDSGVGWIGRVPEAWCTKKFRYVFTESSEKIENEVVGPMLSVSGYRGIEIKEYEDENRRRLDEDLVGYRIVREGQLVVNTMWLNYAGLGVSQHEGHVSPAYRSYAISDVLHRPFAHHLMRSGSYVQGYTRLLTGIRPNSLQMSHDDLMAFPILIPPLPEQKAIACFLDRETVKIDTLVAEQERLIELLKEKRQAVISHAVTKGLNPDVRMKDSGIEWLGQIPAHWTLRRLKHISPFITVGVVVNPSTFVADEGLPFIYGGDIREGVIDWNNSRRIDQVSSQANSKTLLKAGDLLTVRVGAPGVTAVVPKECEGGNCASVMLVRKGEYNSDWLCFVMNTRVVRFQVEVVQYGAAQEQFNISHAVNFWVPTPPREEQDDIAAVLARETVRLDELTAEAQKAIDFLQERRTALISAAVTGQIDVREAAGRAA